MRQDAKPNLITIDPRVILSNSDFGEGCYSSNSPPVIHRTLIGVGIRLPGTKYPVSEGLSLLV
jgi:hypothetical protein